MLDFFARTWQPDIRDICALGFFLDQPYLHWDGNIYLVVGSNITRAFQDKNDQRTQVSLSHREPAREWESRPSDAKMCRNS